MNQYSGKFYWSVGGAFLAVAAGCAIVDQFHYRPKMEELVKSSPAVVEYLDLSSELKANDKAIDYLRQSGGTIDHLLAEARPLEEQKAALHQDYSVKEYLTLDSARAPYVAIGVGTFFGFLLSIGGGLRGTLFHPGRTRNLRTASPSA